MQAPQAEHDSSWILWAMVGDGTGENETEYENENDYSGMR